MCLIALARVLGEYMPHFDPFVPSVWLRCLDTHTYEHKYTLKCVRRSNQFDPSIIQKSFFCHFVLHTNGKRCSGEGSCPCHSQSHVMYAYHVLSLSLQGCVWSKYHFFTLFLARHENTNGCGHIHVLKTFPTMYWFQIHMGSWVYLSWFKCFYWNTTFGIFNLTQGKEEVWPGETQPMLLQSQVVYTYQVFKLVAPRVFQTKYHIWLFLITMVTIFWNFCRCLSWVKAYNYARFQRNPPTG